MSDPGVKACIIATPTPTHEAFVKAAVEGGKHVFCEKPLTSSTAATKACYEAARKNKVILFCAYQRRFDPSYAYLKERAREGAVGPIQLIKMVSKDRPTNTLEYLASSGGIFHDAGTHDIDLMTWILGELPIKVSSET